MEKEVKYYYDGNKQKLNEIVEYLHQAQINKVLLNRNKINELNKNIYSFRFCNDQEAKIEIEKQYFEQVKEQMLTLDSLVKIGSIKKNIKKIAAIALLSGAVLGTSPYVARGIINYSNSKVEKEYENTMKETEKVRNQQDLTEQIQEKEEQEREINQGNYHK